MVLTRDFGFVRIWCQAIISSGQGCAAPLWTHTATLKGTWVLRNIHIYTDTQTEKCFHQQKTSVHLVNIQARWMIKCNNAQYYKKGQCSYFLMKTIIGWLYQKSNFFKFGLKVQQECRIFKNWNKPVISCPVIQIHNFFGCLFFINERRSVRTLYLRVVCLFYIIFYNYKFCVFIFLQTFYYSQLLFCV